MISLLLNDHPVFNETSLSSEQNWFVASLAVADLTLGLVVMPFSLAQEVMGYWVFGEPWCQGRMRINLPIILCRLASSLTLALFRLTR